MNVWIVGTGEMGVQYANCLKELKIRPTIIGRGQASAEAFEKATGFAPIVGGISDYLAQDGSVPDKVIVAVPIQDSFEVTKLLIRRGCKSILAEKPGASTYSEVEQLASIAHDHGSKIFVAYNRRFYASVLKAAELINQTGGVKSFAFEFTEWPHTIEPLSHPASTKNNWFLANSTHLIDLAFFLGGQPREMATMSRPGGISWHPTASIFVGSGVTTGDALFSYHSNWEGPGRWGLEVVTGELRLILRPVEKLHIMRKGSVAIEEFPIDDALDKKHKPGFFLQTKAFLNDDFRLLCKLEDHASTLKHYRLICPYS